MVPYILLTPILIFVAYFMLWPMLNVLIMSLQNYQLIRPHDRGFIGLDNYVNIFTSDPIFFRTLRNTLVWVVGSVVPQAILGFWLAYILNQKFRGRGLYRALVLSPWAIDGVMVAVIFNLIYGETFGVLNDVLRRMGLIETSISWFASGNMAMAAAVIANIWRGIPFFAIAFLSALAGVPDDVYESARIDGAGSMRRLFSITLPMIKDAIVLTTLLRTIWTFNSVDLISVLTYGGPHFATTTLPLYVMNTFTSRLDYGYASALASIAMIIMMVFALVYIRAARLGKGGMY